MEIPLPKPDDENYVQNFCKILSNQYTIITSSGNENSQIESKLIFQLYNFASTAHRPDFISESDWCFLRTNIYLFLSTLEPREDQIPGISLQTNDGVLFSSIIIQYFIRKNNKIFADDLVRAFDYILDTIINRQEPISIYSYSPSFYARILPKLLSSALSEECYKSKFVETLKLFITKRNKYLTDSDLAFYSEIIRILIEKEYYPPVLFSFFNFVFENYQHIPIQIINHFLNSWRMALSVNKSSPPSESEKTEIPSDILLNISKMKAHDLPRSFPWYICFQYYESLLTSPKNQFKVFITINNIIRNIKRIDITNRIDSYAQLFFRVMKTQFKKGGEKEGYYLLYYFLTDVVSTISSATARLKVLKGIQMKHSGSAIVSFAKQPQDGEYVVEIDNDLFTHFDVKECETPEEEIRQFDHMKRTIDSISKQLQFSLKFNIIEPFRIFDLMELPALNDKRITEPTISLIYYLKNVLHSWLNFLVSYSFRVTMMNHYLYQGDGLLKFNGPGPTIRRQLDYSMLHREIIDCVLGLPKELLPLVVTEFIKVMKMGLKNQILTHHIVIFFFASICQKKPVLKNMLLTKMIQHAVSNLQLLTSNNNKSSHFFNQWVLLIFRLGLRPNKPDPNFLYILQTSQKLIVSNIINYMRQVTNATETMKTLDWYRRMMYESAGSRIPVVNDQDMLKVRRHLLDELPSSSHECAIRIIFDPIMMNPKQTLTVSLLSPLLTEAFNSKNESVISMSLKVFVPLLKKESIQKICDFEFDKYQYLFSSLFNSTVYANENDVNTIFHIIPSMSPFFIKKPPKLPIDPFTINFDPYGISVKEALQSINHNIKDDESESVHLFNMYTHLFFITKEYYYANPSQSAETLSSVLSSLVSLYKFDEIREKVFDFLLQHNIEFAKHMIQTHINTYFLVLFSVIGFSRSYKSKYAIDLLHNFLSKLIEYNVEDSAISDTMNDILSSSNISISHFNIFIGLGLIYKHFPNVITISHVCRLFSTTSENIQHDMKNLPLLNKFLKLFLTNGSHETKCQFAEIVYQRIHMIWYGYRFMITNRLSKLGVQLPLKSYNELNLIENNSLFILRSCVAFACGISGDESNFIINNMKTRIKNIIKGLDTSQTQHGFESKVIILIIYFSIISNETARSEFLADTAFVENMFLFLKKMVYRKYPILFRASKKLFKTIFTVCSNYPDIIQIIDKFYSNEPNNFLVSSGITSFVLHLTRIIPHKCPPFFTRNIIETVFSYGKKSTIDQMNLVPAFVCMIKLLVIEGYIRQKEVLDIYNTPKGQHTYYYYLIDVLIRLCLNQEIPYRILLSKQLKKFFLVFPDETIDMIVFNFTDIQMEALSILEEFILQDPTSALMPAFVKAIEAQFDKISFIHPSVYETLLHLFKNDKIISNPQMIEFGKNLFEKFSHEYNINLTYGLHGFMSLMYISKIYLRIICQNLTYENIYSFSKLFLHPSFRSSNIYKKFILIAFNKKESSFYQGLLEFTLQSLNSANNEDMFFIEVIIKHSIKNISNETEEFQSFLWDQVEKMAINPKLNTTRLIIVLRILEMKEIYNYSKVALIIKSITQIYTESNPQHIFLGYKITQALQKHDLLPDKLFLQLISMFIRYGKYLDTPYGYCTMQLMKSRPDLLAKLDKDITKSFLFFTLEKLPFLKDIQKIVFAVQAGPKFLDSLPFSVVAVITNLVEKKLRKIISNTKINSSIENQLTCAIKICIYSQPPNQELQNLYRVCFEYMKIVVNGKLRVKEFPDLLCTVMLKYGCENFNTEFLTLISNSETKEKYYFYFFSCASKFLTNQQIMSFHVAYTKSLKSIPHEYFKTNYISTLIQGITQNEELWNFFSHTIDEVMNDLQSNVSENNIEILIIFIQVIFKANLEIDKIKLIENLWNFIDSLTEEPYLKQLYKFIMSFTDEIPLQKQEYYFDLIKAHSNKTKMHNEALVSTSQILMKCKNFHHSIKLDFIQRMSEFLNSYSIETLERLLETYDEYSESMKIDLFQYKLPIYFHLMMYSTHNKSVIFAENIISVLGNSIQERFKNAIQLFPITVWNDDHIASISVLIFGKVNGWQSMVVFSTSFKNKGSQIFKSLLQTMENNEESLIIMKNLFISLNSLPNCKSAIEALTSILNEADANLSLVLSGAEKSNQLFSLLDKLQPDLIPDVILLPHSLNDSLFSRYRSNNLYTMAAEAQYFLGNYKEAMKVFSSDECSLDSSFDNKIFKLTEIMTQNGEFEYFSRIYFIDETSKLLVSKLYESFVAIRNDDLKAARKNLNETSHIFYLHNKEKEEKTIYERNFSDNIQFLLCHFEHAAEETKNSEVELTQFPVYYSNMAFSPSYQTLFKEINRDLFFKLDPNDTIPKILINDDQNFNRQFIVVSPGIEKLFSFINGYDCHGFASVNIPTILDYSRNFIQVLTTTENSEKEGNSINYVSIHRWAGLCFTLFLKIQSPIMLSSAFNSYIKLLSVSEFVPYFIKFESSARIITLLRLGLSDPKNEDYRKACEKASNKLASPEFEPKREILQFWIRQVVELQSFPPFAKIFENKMQEYIGFSTLYSMGKQSFDEIIKGQMKDENVRSQMNTLHLFEEVIDFIFAMKYEEFQVQILLESLFYEMRNSERDFEKFDFIELRNKHVKDSLDQYLYLLPLHLVERLNNDSNLSEKIKRSSPSEITELIEFYYPSSSGTFEINKRELYRRIDELNNVMPLPFPTRISTTFTSYLIFLQYNIKKINDSLFAFTFKTSVMKNHTFVVQRNENYTDQQKCTTFSSFLLLLKQINRYSHSNRIRSIRYSTYLGSDVGQHYSIYAIANLPHTLEDLFEIWCGEKSSNWNGDRDEIPDDVLLKHISYCYSKQEFIKNQELLVRSASATFLIDHLFLSNYPSMETTMICTQQCEIPILFREITADFHEKSFSSFRLSPNIKRAFGPFYKGKMIISMASSAQSLVKFFESTNSFIELMICEELKNNLSVSSMIEMEGRINHEILKFVPPDSDGTTPKDSADWIGYIDYVIDKAADASIQPVERFPWF